MKTNLLRVLLKYTYKLITLLIAVLSQIMLRIPQAWRKPLLLICIVLFAVAWIDYVRVLNRPLITGEEPQTYVVESGSNLTRIVYDLEKKGFIERPRYLLLHARLHGSANQINTGEYLIKPKETAKQFLQQLFDGKVVQYALTIVEGWNFSQLMSELSQNTNLLQTLQGLSDKAIMNKLGYPEQHPEGRFYPDTYLFPRGTTDVQFLQRAYRAMEQYLQQAWQERDVGLPFKTMDEALVMASVVEKETGLASERRAIAGVFIRRLEKRIRLQSDPTVIYGMGKRYKGNIRKRDLLEETPYNTYRRFGLPPTPIAMPGKEAIYATLHPQDGDALYFVSRGDGSHYFSATLEEHNQAVIKYQLKGRKKSFSSFDAKTGKTKPQQ